MQKKLYTQIQFFHFKEDEILGPNLLKWYQYMNTQVSWAKEIYMEMIEPLEAWKVSGRFEPIMAEMKSEK